MNTYQLISLLLVMILSSCDGILSEDNNPPPPPPPERDRVNSIRGVKLISPDIRDGRDENSFLQDEYSLNSNSRLLIRFEKIKDEVGSIIIDENKRMFLVLKLQDGQLLEDYFGKIKVCPALKNWMMLATWNFANPFAGKNGKWTNAGGDYSASECIFIDEKHSKENSNEAYFDISNWYIHNIQSNRANLGWVLISPENVQIVGDNNATYSPRVLWREIVVKN
jgi:hypothetical protein